eukprot:7054735-Prymnesium_polylepis.1
MVMPDASRVKAASWSAARASLTSRSQARAPCWRAGLSLRRTCDITLPVTACPSDIVQTPPPPFAQISDACRRVNRPCVSLQPHTLVYFLAALPLICLIQKNNGGGSQGNVEVCSLPAPQAKAPAP